MIGEVIFALAWGIFGWLCGVGSAMAIKFRRWYLVALVGIMVVTGALSQGVSLSAGALLGMTILGVLLGMKGTSRREITEIIAEEV